ncbi:hypothetical protein P175DRAFT_0530623 [Aspergillus ochraceoroseus IBT 24754]|uniref:Uncharacterized protein n=1 Tax=Aspergillus ochraceoroseus IBT 24754 TaxID=1392256 RepID=A0A2T5M4N6_9EURO|nr:uncharacterized protein P175DRAFT_0530623 [Aspergillus ochraceoroseus IBT 24754]PTU23503.1 hypothetical protein P175DRAFT_0530623 [Aspergillus ochraceoroseus IBT 24754]
MSFHPSTQADLTQAALCFAELISYLEKTVQEAKIPQGVSHDVRPRDPPVYTFEPPLLESLSGGCLPNTKAAEELLSFVNTHKDRLAHSLEGQSLRSLACYLLNSRIEPGLASGLCLLLNQPRHLADSGWMKPFAPSLEDCSHSLRWNLIPKLCEIFTCEGHQGRIRRMAGKILVEMLYASKENCGLLMRLLEHDPNIWPFIDTFYSSDPILSFYTCLIVRAFRHFKMDIVSYLARDEHELKVLTAIQCHYGNVVDLLYRFLCSLRHTLSPELRARDGFKPFDGALHMCYCLQKDGIPSKLFSKGPVLLIFHGSVFLSIHCQGDAVEPHFEYMALPASSPSYPRYRVIRHLGGERFSLSFQFDKAVLLYINDQARSPESFSLKLEFEGDLMELQTMLNRCGFRCENQEAMAELSISRSSYVVIPLDAGEDITLKSRQFSEKPCQTELNTGEKGPSSRIEPPVTSGEWNELSGTSPLTELTHTPTICDELALKHGNTALSKSYPASPSMQTPEFSDTMSRARRLPTSICQNDAQNANNETQPTLTERLPGEPILSPNHDESKDRETKELRYLQPDTQESLIFPRRRFRGKLYTAPSKKMVSCDEQSAASDSTIAECSREEDELTYISSPLPGTSFLPQQPSLSGTQKNEFHKGQPSAKARNTPKTSRSKGAKLLQLEANRRASRRTLHTNKSENSQVKLIKRNQTENKCRPQNGLPSTLHPSSSTKGGPDNIVYKKFDCRGLRLDGTSTTSHSQVTDSMSHSVRETDKSPGKNKSLSRSADNQHLVQAHQGRGRTVAEKLIAAFQQTASSLPKHSSRGSLEKFHAERVCELESIAQISQQSECLNDELHNVGGLPDFPASSSPVTSQEDIVVHSSLVSPPQEKPNTLSSVIGAMHSNSDVIRKAVIMDADIERNGDGKEGIPSLVPDSWPESPLKQPKTPSSGNTLQDQAEGCNVTLKHPKRGRSPRANDQLSNPVGELLRKDSVVDPFYAASSEDKNYENSERIVSESDIIPRTIVDGNGSPRLLHRDQRCATPKRLLAADDGAPLYTKRRKVVNEAHDEEGIVTQPDNNIKDTCCTENTPLTTACSDAKDQARKNMSCASARVVGDSRMVKGASTSEVEESAQALTNFCATLRKSHSQASRLRCTSYPRVSQEPQEPQKTRKVAHDAGRGEVYSPSIQKPSPTQLPADPAILGGHRLLNRTLDSTEDQSSLPEFHEGLRNMLVQHNAEISRQIQNEGHVIHRALETYRAQCHNLLNQVFETQRDRIRLCEQQMASITQQHRDVCQGLIRRMEENERSLGGLHDGR